MIERLDEYGLPELSFEEKAAQYDKLTRINGHATDNISTVDQKADRYDRYVEYQWNEHLKKKADDSHGKNGATEEKKIFFEVLKPSELRSYQPKPGIVLVGDNHIVRGSVFVIAGCPGVGKSRAGVALAEAGASKFDWFGHKVHCNFKTLIIQNENGRLRLKMEFSSLDDELLDQFVRVSPPPPFGLCFNKSEFRDQLKAVIDNQQPGVILIDPWNAVARDDKAKDYLETFDLIRSVIPAGDDGPALGIFPHTRKPNPNERPNGRALLNLLSGSYVLASVPRCVWVLQSASDLVTEDRVVVTCCKNNDGELGNRSVWIRNNGQWPAVTEFDWDTFDYGEVQAKAIKFGVEELVEILMKFPMGISQSKLIEEIKNRGVSKSSAYRVFDKAEKSRAIKHQKGKDTYVVA